MASSPARSDDSSFPTLDKRLPLSEQPSLHALLSQSPLRCLDFEQSSIQSPVRDVDLSE
jgi:hypothetical protein